LSFNDHAIKKKIEIQFYIAAFAAANVTDGTSAMIQCCSNRVFGITVII